MYKVYGDSCAHQRHYNESTTAENELSYKMIECCRDETPLFDKVTELKPFTDVQQVIKVKRKRKRKGGLQYADIF